MISYMMTLFIFSFVQCTVGKKRSMVSIPTHESKKARLFQMNASSSFKSLTLEGIVAECINGEENIFTSLNYNDANLLPSSAPFDIFGADSEINNTNKDVNNLNNCFTTFGSASSGFNDNDYYHNSFLLDNRIQKVDLNMVQNESPDYLDISFSSSDLHKMVPYVEYSQNQDTTSILEKDFDSEIVKNKLECEKHVNSTLSETTLSADSENEEKLIEEILTANPFQETILDDIADDLFQGLESCSLITFERKETIDHNKIDDLLKLSNDLYSLAQSKILKKETLRIRFYTKLLEQTKIIVDKFIRLRKYRYFINKNLYKEIDSLIIECFKSHCTTNNSSTSSSLENCNISFNTIYQLKLKKKTEKLLKKYFGPQEYHPSLDILLCLEYLQLIKYVEDIPELLLIHKIVFKKSAHRSVFLYLRSLNLYLENVSSVKLVKDLIFNFVEDMFYRTRKRRFRLNLKENVNIIVPSDAKTLSVCDKSHLDIFYFLLIESRSTQKDKFQWKERADIKMTDDLKRHFNILLVIRLYQHMMINEYYGTDSELLKEYEELLECCKNDISCCGCYFQRYLNFLKRLIVLNKSNN